jgi:hypothetical protein
MEMKGSVGELSAKVDRLIADTKSQGEKIEGIRMLLAWVAGGSAMLGAILALGVVVLKYWPIK